MGTVLAALLHHRSLVLALNRLGWVDVLVLLLLLHRQVRLGYSLPFAGSPLQVAERKSQLSQSAKGCTRRAGEGGRRGTSEHVMRHLKLVANRIGLFADGRPAQMLSLYAASGWMGLNICLIGRWVRS